MKNPDIIQGMGNITVCGIVNLETSLKVSSFPLHYFPVCYPYNGISTAVSGTGGNISAALKTLGNKVNMVSVTGNDLTGQVIREFLKEKGFSLEYVAEYTGHSAQSVVLYDDSGKRQVHTDLKEIQKKIQFSEETFRILRSSEAAVLCNVNFSRPLLIEAKKAGIPVITDVHAISDSDDEYNSEFLKNASVLFLSHENLTGNPLSFSTEICERYNSEIIITGMGKEGALLTVRNPFYQRFFPAVNTRTVVSTAGAGDALLSAFTHFFLKGVSPEKSVYYAQFFASWKIGETGGSKGFLTEQNLMELAEEE